MLLFKARSPGPGFSECASYVFASIFLWATVAIALVGFSDFFFYLDGKDTGGAALIFGGILIGLAIAIGTGVLLGAFFSLVALVRFNERPRLWPLLVPAALLLIYFLVIGLGFFEKADENTAPFTEEKSLLLAHSLGYLAVASLAILWISRLSIILAIPAVLVFMWASLGDVAVQYWALDRLGELETSDSWDNGRINGDFHLQAPSWVEWLAGDGYKTFRIKADVEPAELIEDARVTVRVTPRLFGSSATGTTYLSLSVDSGRVASVTVPSFIAVTGPVGVRGRNPTRERAQAVRAQIFGRDGATVSPWLRTDQINQLRCTVHDYAPGDCEILSELPEAP